ncbi:hypothetical protein AB0K23_29945 [Streptomyces sp. NPDC049602]|uniref:hypothetical protein n=1 Tax=Streptomyces sp. NPDC049602 TaxID=3155504 RepID=UPI00341DD48F
MAETVNGGGWAPSEPVQDALRTVPRHRFAPEANLAAAYDGGDRAVVTRRDETGRAISSVSAAWLQADVIESPRLRPAAIVFEAGSGGYNAELIAHVARTEGHVVTVDIDLWLVHRTRRFTTEAGSGRVTVVEADATLGAPAYLVPRGGLRRQRDHVQPLGHRSGLVGTTGRGRTPGPAARGRRLHTGSRVRTTRAGPARPPLHALRLRTRPRAAGPFPPGHRPPRR